MAFCDSASLASLLIRWGEGSLDYVGTENHVVLGVDGCSVGFKGLQAQTLAQRFTSEDINKALRALAIAGQQGFAVALTCIYLLGWSVERLGRVLEHPDVSHTLTYVITAEDAFAGKLLDGEE
ncbi:MAG: hypothetical protein F6K42_18095 [Leptolyngbya sp. SIO1D8]|nr:hypothetical protein [Leptolyngbya sp. SIO1D8]